MSKDLYRWNVNHEIGKNIQSNHQLASRNLSGWSIGVILSADLKPLASVLRSFACSQCSDLWGWPEFWFSESVHSAFQVKGEIMSFKWPQQNVKSIASIIWANINQRWKQKLYHECSSHWQVTQLNLSRCLFVSFLESQNTSTRQPWIYGSTEKPLCWRKGTAGI